MAAARQSCTSCSFEADGSWTIETKVGTSGEFSGGGEKAFAAKSARLLHHHAGTGYWQGVFFNFIRGQDDDVDEREHHRNRRE